MNYIPPKKENVENLVDNSLYFELYPANEQNLLKSLEQLFIEWHLEFKKSQDSNGHLIKDYKADDMSFDGFYPNYLNQNLKLLFIAREGLGISGDNYIEVLYKALKNKYIDGKTLNQHQFHRRIIYLTYALQTGITNYDMVPYAEEIIPSFGTKILSFAFMNISKFSNESEDYKSDYDLINKSVELSIIGRNFLFDEIAMLQPDVIIIMNLPEYYSKIGSIEPINDKNLYDYAVKPFKIELNSKPTLLIDTYHFSAIISERKYFFDEIINCIRSNAKQFDLKLK